MVYKSGRLGGLRLSVSADRAGSVIGLSLGGSAWRAIVDTLRGPRLPPVNALDGDAINRRAALPMTLADEVASFPWYHTIDLGHGVVTKGQFDHGAILDRYRFPESFAGKRVLDVATFDGFWAFEFERRGAREVIALDLERPSQLDWQPALLATATPELLEERFGRGFAIAKRELKSTVERVACSVYDLKPELFGRFDVVHAGDFLLHINSPVKALQNIAAVCDEYALISEVYYPSLEHHDGSALMEYMGGGSDVTWWRFSLTALQRMVLDAGFSRVEVLAKFLYGQRTRRQDMHHVVLKAWK